jgi:NADH dehydrogenase
MQEGKYVGKVIKARLAGDERVEPFEYFDKGSMATIGHRSAVADAFGMKFTGVIGYTMWGFIHVLYLIGWGNRLGTLYTWARALTFSNNRGHRIITFRQAAEPPPDEDCRPAETAVRPVDLRQPQAMHFPHRPQHDPGLRRQEET